MGKKTSDIDKLKKILGTENIYYRPRSKKCRYVYYISSDKRENQKLKQLCKYEIKNYYSKELPKEREYKTLKQGLINKNAV